MTPWDGSPGPSVLEHFNQMPCYMTLRHLGLSKSFPRGNWYLHNVNTQKTLNKLRKLLPSPWYSGERGWG